MRRRSALLALTVLLAAPTARADDQPTPARWALRGSVSGGLMISDDQREMLALDGPGATLRLAVAGRPFDGIDWLEGELTAGGSLVQPGQERPGGAIDVQLAARVAPSFDVITPFVAFGIGVAFTGGLVRPATLTSLGVAFQATRELAIAVDASLLHVMQIDGPRQSDDALFLSGGLGVWWRPFEQPSAPAERTEDRPRRRAPPPPPPPAPPPRREMEEDLDVLLERAIPARSLDIVMLVPPVLFEHGESELTAAGEVTMHDVLDRVSAADPRARIVIQGHADATGTPEINMPLSLGRAETVASWLEARGVPRSRMVLRGEGSTRPLVQGAGDDIAALAPDRRVTIRLELELDPEEAP